MFAWKPELRFIHLMRAGSSEMLSPSKLLWLQAAFAEGVAPPRLRLALVRWGTQGRVLRLTDYTYDRLNRWVEWQNGELIYSDGQRRNGMVEHYRDWGAQTGADLLWLVFRAQ